MDKQIIERFELFQKETGRYPDLDIKLLRFEDLKFSDEGIFKFVKGQNKYVQNYINHNPGDIAELGSSLNNDCINSYITPFSESDIIKDECVSFNKDNAKGSRAFYRNFPFVMDRHHIAIIPNKKLVDTKYFHKYFDQFLILKNYGWGENTANVDEIQNYHLKVPKALSSQYTSILLQQIIVQFIEHYEIVNKNKIKYILEALEDVKKIESVFLSLLFNKDDSIAVRFNKYCTNKLIDLQFEDIRFNIRKIHSDNKADLVCKKRMGFTPKRIKDGSIFWYTVGDLTFNKSIFIDNPTTKQKTTLPLIRNKISEKSSKIIPIQKGDVLVSFLLTVGTVKIYNSAEVAYCNQAIDILTPNEEITSQFLAYNCMYEYPKYGIKTNNGITLNDDEKKLVNIRIPENTTKYSSIELQEILINFTEEYLEKLHLIKQQIIELQTMFENYNEAIIHKTFN